MEGISWIIVKDGRVKQTMSSDFPPFQQVRDPCSWKMGRFYNALGVKV
jgi:hypothetical protein